MKTLTGLKSYSQRIIRNANRKGWEMNRQRFMIGASCAGDVVGVGRSSRNQVLQRYVWKAFKRLIRKRGANFPLSFISKKEERPVNEFLQRKMDNGCKNEERMMKVVRTHGLTVSLTMTPTCAGGWGQTLTPPTANRSEEDGTLTCQVEMIKDSPLAPGNKIEDWTIVESPFDSRMACSPDGLYVKGGLGYEFKTKDFVRVPQTAEEVLDCEYLQCQTCLSFCRDFVWAWILCYNRLDTGEFKAYMIVLDEELWDGLMEGVFTEFVDRAESVAAKLYEECTRGDLSKPVQFEPFFDVHKYKPFVKGVKGERRAQLIESKKAHVLPIQFK